MPSEISSLTIVYSTIYSRHRSKLRLTGLCEGNSPVTMNSPHKGPVTRKMFPFDDVILAVLFLYHKVKSLQLIWRWGICRETMSARSSNEFLGFDLTHLPLNKMAAILANNIFECIFLNENDRIPIQISLKFVPRIPIDNKAALVQVMAWRWTGNNPLPEPMMAQFTDAYMRH